MIENVPEEELKKIVNRHLPKIYALVFYLIGGDKDKSFQVVVSSYVETFLALDSVEDEDLVIVALAQKAIKISHGTECMPTTNMPPFKNVPPEKGKLLHILSNALQEMSFKDRALILLRDQLHLSYRNIALTLGVSEKEALSHINLARLEVRKKVEKALL